MRSRDKRRRGEKLDVSVLKMQLVLLFVARAKPVLRKIFMFLFCNTLWGEGKGVKVGWLYMRRGGRGETVKSTWADVKICFGGEGERERERAVSPLCGQRVQNSRNTLKKNLLLCPPLYFPI